MSKRCDQSWTDFEAPPPHSKLGFVLAEHCENEVRVSTRGGRRKGPSSFGRSLACLFLIIPFSLFASTIAIDEDTPWPRVRSLNGTAVTMHLPQVEHWTSNWFRARAVVEVKTADAKKPQTGVAWFEAHGSVDRSNRVVTLDRFEITRGNFPEAPDKGSNALAAVRLAMPSGARTVSLDYLITALGFIQAEVRKGAHGLKHDPPQIIWATNRTTLVLIDGDPVLRPITGTTLERVINCPVLLVRDKTAARFYLEGDGQWFVANSIDGSWSLAQSTPPEVAALSTNTPSATGTEAGESPPRIMVSTRPAELLQTLALPDYRPIRGTSLQYMADSDSLVFFHSTERALYLLLSGRWFKASSLHGPWNHVAPDDLPDDFSKIPVNSPQAIVLASVPGTPQAELALIANSAPTTATVSRRTQIEVQYDGEPKFQPIEGTKMSYAVNAQLPVVKTGDRYYAVDNGVWFLANLPTGPWEVAAEVPEEIYTIPPNSPVYYATYVRVYNADDENVETGYTSGYAGAYEDDGTVVYGTGYQYEPWYGSDYYGWGWTWGYSYWYVPWYQWWVWRPWWVSSGIRAALIENIYDRWQSGIGVTPHDRSTSGENRSLRANRSSGHPALYGRFKGATRPASLSAPANTLALNPYSRPQASSANNRDVPRGAQLLSSVRQTPTGGRDLYASPDGNVYRRKADGWYRRQPAGNWSFVAPAQNAIERGQLSPGGGGQPLAAGAGSQMSPGAKRAATAQTRGRVPDSGTRMQEREVMDLERQYYARTLSQARSQNVRSSYGSRPARTGGRRR
jgi:hypothetical protein